MSDLVKKKIIEVDTGQATKNVDNLTKSFVPLRKQIKDLINEMGQLTKGTEEYDRAALKLAELQQKQREIAEASKYSNKDFGAVMSNLTKVSVGLVGGINALSASMAMLSSDSEEVQKALQKIQLVMAVIQGFSALDTALKSIKGLFNAFGGVATEAEQASKSIGELNSEIDSIGDKTIDLTVDTDPSSVEKVKEEIDSISGEKVDVDIEADSTSIEKAKSDIESIGDKTVGVKVEADTSSVDAVKSDLESITDETVSVNVEADTTGVDKVKSDLESIKDETVNVDIETGDASKKVSEVKAELESIGDESVSITVDNTESTVATEETRTEIESLPDTHNTDITVNTGEAIPQLEAVRAEIESIPDTKVVNVEEGGVGEATESVKKLSKAEGEAANTANTLGKANNVLTKTSKGVVGGLKAIATGLKNAAKAMIQFIASNPILAAIAAAIAAVAGGIALLNKRMEEQGRIAKEESNILSEVNNQYKDQTVRLNVLLKTAQNENESLEERKKAVEELNKIVPDYNAQLDETSGLYTANAEALETYMNNLKQKLMLEAYEGKIKEYLQKQLELEEEINDIENTGWFATQRRIRKRKEEISDLEKDITRIYGKISELDLGAALNDNKVVNDTKKTTGAVRQQIKKIADAIKDLKKIVVDLWDTFYNQSFNNLTTPVDSFNDMLNEIQNNMKRYDLGKHLVQQGSGKNAADIFTKEFASQLQTSAPVWSKFFSGFNTSDIFSTETLKRIDDLKKKSGEYATQLQQVIDKYEGLKRKNGELTVAETKEYEILKTRYEQAQQTIQNELTGYSNIIKAVTDYYDIVRGQVEAEQQHSNEIQKKNALLKIEKQYYEDLRKNDPMADTNRNLAAMGEELEYMKRNNEFLKQRLSLLTVNEESAKKYAEEIAELQRQIAMGEKEVQDQELQIDIASYQKRLQEAQTYFDAIGQMAADQMNKITIDNGGNETGNTQLQKLQVEAEAIQKQIDLVQQMYEQGLISQEEYNTRSLDLAAQLATKEQEINRQRMDNFSNTTGQIVSVFQSVAGSVTGALQEMMEGMDEGSEEYKKLAVTTAIIQTLSGTLGAFMSGVNSGIPAPWNLILAGVMAATTAATGAIQIAKIKQGTDASGGASSMTSAASSIGSSQYETTAFQQQTELMGTVKDQRVYVTEHDISTAQNNVQVREHNSTF